MTAGEEQSGQVRDCALLRRLLALLRPYTGCVASSVFCAIADMGLQILGPLVISVAVDRYFLGRPRTGLERSAWLHAGREQGLPLL